MDKESQAEARRMRHRRRMGILDDQENANVVKGKGTAILPIKTQGMTPRGALGDLNTNAKVQKDLTIGKMAVATEKNASLNRATVTSQYSHVRATIDSGLAVSKPTTKGSARPPLTRQLNTAALARTKDTTKETEPIESLGNLKLAETPQSPQQASLDKECPPLPPGVVDIDESDRNKQLNMTCYIKDIYCHLFELELKYPIEPDHLRNQAIITGHMRATLIDWLVEVQGSFSLQLETFHLTVGIIDRYLQVAPTVQCNQLQLVGATAMFTAGKYEEVMAPAVENYLHVCDNIYRKVDVLRCERDIMAKLDYCLSKPVPLYFLRRCVKAARCSSKSYHLGKYFIDVSLVDYSMAHYRPSELAAAALCLSIYVLTMKEMKEFWTSTMIYYSKYTLEHIDPIMKKIAKIVVNMPNSVFKAAYTRYLDPKFKKVSSLPELKAEAIQNFAKK